MNTYKNKSNGIECLPTEILYLILKYLKPIDVVTCYSTSKKLNQAVTGIEAIRKNCKLTFVFLIIS